MPFIKDEIKKKQSIYNASEWSFLMAGTGVIGLGLAAQTQGNFLAPIFMGSVMQAIMCTKYTLKKMAAGQKILNEDFETIKTKLNSALIQPQPLANKWTTLAKTSAQHALLAPIKNLYSHLLFFSTYK